VLTQGGDPLEPPLAWLPPCWLRPGPRWPAGSV